MATIAAFEILKTLTKIERERMDGEIHRFIEVWIIAISCLCYCYYISARLPEGLLRLFSILPIIYLFIILPFNLSCFHLGAPTIFFLSWLSTFKLFLFSFNEGPLSPSPPTIFHFISIAALPIKLKQDQPPRRNTNPDLINSANVPLDDTNTNPSHQTTPFFTINPEKTQLHDTDSSTSVKSVSVGIKLLLLAMIICAYDHRENLHPCFILALYCCHLYLALEILLGLAAIPARDIFGFELEPQSNEPYLSTSLQDFWGRRWNLMVTNVLRPAVYHPLRRLLTPVLGPKWGQPPAAVATFVVSGLMHEFIFYYFARVPPTWEVTWFFVLHGVCTAVEVAAKKAVVHRGWRLNQQVSRMLTIAFLVVTGEWLFFPEIIRNGIDTRAIGEYAIMVEFVKSKLVLHLYISNK